jgi:carbamoyltransferase
MSQPLAFLGICEGYDPSVAIVVDGKVIAFAEEERFIRYKHAHNIYPENALRYCLEVAGMKMQDIASVGVHWNLDVYENGCMQKFFDQMRAEFQLDPDTAAWQNSRLKSRNRAAYQKRHSQIWRRMFGDIGMPQICPIPHHFTHAFQACRQSGFERSVVISVDGSGDQHCTVLWKHEGSDLTPLREILMPHSLGWFYSAITEYLGFEAYDGEYKVMGLAAYGRPAPDLMSKVRCIVQDAADGVQYRVDPRYIHYGAHSYSGRYTDELPKLLGRPPRLRNEEITAWHEDLAYAVQLRLEDAVERLVVWAVEETGIPDVCISGGVGMNIKMNSRLFKHPKIRDVFAHPLCSDSGSAAGAALAACHQVTGAAPERLTTLALGPEAANETIESLLHLANLEYSRPTDLEVEIARELAAGRVVGWYQGRMEAGQRALGQRSILADPRNVANRDKVNAIIKFREYWRPFCPSMTEECAPRYFDRYTEAPYMIIAFDANDRLKAEAPAIVHIDGTSRVQFVNRERAPRYHRLLTEFEKLTGVPVLLNTSFNVKGEPIVCTPKDALRTFWSTGLEVLAIGDFVVRKPRLE